MESTIIGNKSYKLFFLSYSVKGKKKMRLLICHSAIEHGFSMGKINMIVRREE